MVVGLASLLAALVAVATSASPLAVVALAPLEVIGLQQRSLAAEEEERNTPSRTRGSKGNHHHREN